MSLNKNMLDAIQMLVYTDKSKGEICKDLGVAPNAMSRWLAKEDFQQALRDEMHKGFNDLAIKARKRLDKLIESKNDVVALGACKEVLNKAGYMEAQKVEQKVDTTIRVDVVE